MKMMHNKTLGQYGITDIVDILDKLRPNQTSSIRNHNIGVNEPSILSRSNTVMTNEEIEPIDERETSIDQSRSFSINEDAPLVFTVNNDNQSDHFSTIMAEEYSRLCPKRSVDAQLDVPEALNMSDQFRTIMAKEYSRLCPKRIGGAQLDVPEALNMSDQFRTIMDEEYSQLCPKRRRTDQTASRLNQTNWMGESILKSIDNVKNFHSSLPQSND